MDKGDRKGIKGNRTYLKVEGEQTFKKEEVVNIIKYHSQIQRMRKAKKPLDLGNRIFSLVTFEKVRSEEAEVKF